MGERYSRVYSLPENLYLDDSPVLIAAGALLKDNKTGDVLVQLKLRNLYHSPLTACKVSIRAFDPSNAELTGMDGYSYLDLSVERGADFGSREAIRLPDITTRRFSVSIIQAVFENGTVWQHPVAEWTQPMLKKQQLSDVLTDYELREQYRIETGGESNYVPEMAGSLFLCACGTLNLTSEKTCCNCHREYNDLITAFDVESLTSKKDERLAKEEAERQERMRLEAEREKERQRKKEEEREELLRQAEEQRKAERAARKKKNIIALTVTAIIIFLVGLGVYYGRVVLPESKYKSAEVMLVAEDYEGAIAAFDALGNYKDAAERKIEAENQRAYNKAEELLAFGDYVHAAIAFYNIRDYKDARERNKELLIEIGKKSAVSAGQYHTVGLHPDGTVDATPTAFAFDFDQCDVSDWTDVIEVSAGVAHTVGLRSDGTVVATGFNDDGECNVSGWTNIVAVSAGAYHTVGLRSDGTVVATGIGEANPGGVSSWTDIETVSAGAFHTVGLCLDGTVVATGSNNLGECDVSSWTDIIAVSAGFCYTVGLRSDGTVVATGYNSDGQCDVSGWSDIVAVSAGGYHTVGLRSDGTVVATGNNDDGQCNVSDWKDIMEVSAGIYQTVGLHWDGTMVAEGNNDNNQCYVEHWSDIGLPVPD